MRLKASAAATPEMVGPQVMLENVELFTNQRWGAAERSAAHPEAPSPASSTASGAFGKKGATGSPRAQRPSRVPRIPRLAAQRPRKHLPRHPSALRPPQALPTHGYLGGRGCRLWPESFGF